MVIYENFGQVSRQSLHLQVRRHFSLIVIAIYTFWLLLLKFIMNSTAVFLIQHELIHRRDAQVCVLIKFFTQKLDCNDTTAGW